MRIALIAPGAPAPSRALGGPRLPSLGLLTLAGMTPDRFEVTYHEVEDVDALDALPDCDVAALSAPTACVKDAYRLARRYYAVAAFVEQTPLDGVQLRVATPSPGAPLHARLALEGRLLDPTAWERRTLFDVNFRPWWSTPAELEKRVDGVRRRLCSAGTRAARLERCAPAVPASSDAPPAAD